MTQDIELSGAGGKGGGSGALNEHDNTIRSNTVASQLQILSRGPIRGLVNGAASIYIGNTALQTQVNTNGVITKSNNFERVGYDLRTGTPTQEPIKGFEAVQSPVLINTNTTTAAPVTRTVSSADVDAVLLTISFPDGLYNQNTGNNSIERTTVAVRFQVKLTSSGTWITVDEQPWTDKATANTSQSFRIPRPSGTGLWDWRVVRITNDSTSGTLKNTTRVTTAVEIQNETVTYPDMALLGAFIDSAGVTSIGSSVPDVTAEGYWRIVQVPTNFNTNTRIFSGTWNGLFKNDWTNDTAWVLYDLCSMYLERIGLDDTYLDKVSFYEASVYNSQFLNVTYDGVTYTTSRYSFNTQLTDGETGITLLQKVAGAMNAKVAWVNNLLTVVQDRPGDLANAHVLNNTNCEYFKRSTESTDTTFTVANVTWNDPGQLYKQAVVPVVAAQAELDLHGYIETNIAALGCTSYSQAIRFGQHYLETAAKPRKILEFKTGEYGKTIVMHDLVKVYDENWAGQIAAGRLKAGSTTTTLVLDRTVSLSANATITLITQNGTIVADRAITTTGSASTIVLTTALSSAPAEFCSYIITTNDIAAETYRVTAVKQDDDGFYVFTAVEYDEGKYARLDQTKTVPKKIYSNLTAYTPTQPTGVTISERSAVLNLVTKRTLTVSWNQAVSTEKLAGYKVLYKVNSGTPIELRLTQNYFEVEVADGVFEVYIQALGLNGTPSVAAYGKYTVASTEATGSVLNPVTGLYVLGTTGTAFTGRDLTVEWTNPTTNGSTTQTVARFKVEVYNGATLLRTAYANTVPAGTKQTFTYAWGDNVADGGPRRSVTIKVYAQDVGLKLSAVTTATFTNAVPALPSNITFVPSSYGIQFKCDKPTDADYAGVLIWGSTTSGFTTNSSTLLHDGEATTTITAVGGAKVTPATPYYFKVAAYDGFDKVGLTISSQYSTTTTAIPLAELTGTLDATKIAGQLVDTQLAAIAAAKVTGQITETQIGVDSVSTPHLKAKSVTTDKVVMTAGNLIANADFATGDFTNWNCWSNPTYQSVIVSTTAGVPASPPARYVAKFTSPGTAVQIATFAARKVYSMAGADTDGFAVTAGKQYYVALDAAKSADAVFTTFNVMVYFWKADGTYTANVAPIVGASLVSTTWSTLEGSFTAPTGALRAWAYVISQAHSAGSIYWTNLRASQKAGGELIVDGSLTASKAYLTDLTNVCPDGSFLDDNAWAGESSWQSASNSTWRTGRVATLSGAGGSYATLTSRVFTVDAGAKYYISGQVYNGSASGGFGVQLVTSTTSDMATPSYPGGASTTALGTITDLSATVTIPAGHRYAQLQFYKSNTGATTGYVAAPVVRRALMGELFVDGTIKAQHVDTKGLTIKDNSGNILFGVANPLDFANVGGTTKPEDNATVGAQLGTNLTDTLGNSLGDAQVLNSLVGGVNLVYGLGEQSSIPAGTYGLTLFTLKDASTNVHTLQPGEKLTVSAELWCDAAALGAGQGSRLYLYTTDAAGAWKTSTSMTVLSTTGGFQSGTLTLPATAADMVNVRVGLYHNGGNPTATGVVYARKVQVERGSVATLYAPGSNPAATVGAPAGTYVNGVAVENVTDAVDNFNASNDRNSAAVVAPTIASDGTAIDHVLLGDGSANISFEWSWGGTAGDIDGFLIYVYGSGASGAYTFGTSVASEQVFVVPAEKRAFFMLGASATLYWTFGIAAYRKVDKDINTAGVIKSAIVKSTATGEATGYRPSASIAFTGDITGTINGTLSTADVNAWTAITGSTKPEDNATAGATWGVDIADAPYSQIYNNDDSVALGFNPTFDWPSGSYPTNWVNWTGNAPTKETSIVRIGSAAVKYTAAGGSVGMQRSLSLATTPLPAGTFLSGSVDMYLDAVTSGLPGVLVRLYTNSALSTFVDTKVQPPTATLDVWQRVPWVARVAAGQQIYGIHIYVMGSWTSFASGAFTGTVIFDNLRFMLADQSLDNKTITLAADGTLSGAGGGAVTITGLGYTGALNATNNVVTASTSAPASPTDGDIWIDTNSPVTIKTRVSGAWVSGGNVATSLSQVNATEGTKLSGIATGATKNVVTSGLLSARPTGADGDFYYATDTAVLYQKVSGSWITGATNNTVTSGTSAPASPTNGDIWIDTNSPVTIKTRVSGAWVAGGNVATSLSQVNATEGTKLSGIAAGATANIVGSGLLSARPTGANGDFYYATDTAVLYQKVSGSWVSGATNNTVTSGTSAPASPTNGDIWIDTNSPVTIKTRVSGAWVAGGNVATSLSQVNATEGTKLSGIAAGATANIVSTGTFAARPTGANGDFYYATDTYELFQKVSGSWVLASTNGADVGSDLRDSNGNVLTDGLVKNNLVDSSYWGTGINGWTNYSSTGTNAIVTATNPKGQFSQNWRVTATVGQVAWQGGYVSPRVKTQANRVYRVVIPVRRLSGTAGEGSIYLGVYQDATAAVCNVGTTTTASNPYFFNTTCVSMIADEWYYAVGYLYASGTNGTLTSAGAGLYRASTGALAGAGTSFSLNSASTSFALRTGLYQSPTAFATAQAVEFAPCFVHVMDGTEPSVRELMSNTAVLNSAVTLTESAGVIGINPNGAGGATVTTVTSNNKITSTNVSTYMASAAIQTAYIADLAVNTAKIADLAITNAKIGNSIQSTNFNGTVDASGVITNVGTTGWALGKAGAMVVDAAHVRGKLTTSQLQVGAATSSVVNNSASATISALGAATTSRSGTLTGPSLTTIGQSVVIGWTGDIYTFVSSTAFFTYDYTVILNLVNTSTGITYQSIGGYTTTTLGVQGRGDFHYGSTVTGVIATPPAGTYRVDAYASVNSRNSSGTITANLTRLDAYGQFFIIEQKV